MRRYRWLDLALVAAGSATLCPQAQAATRYPVATLSTAVRRTDGPSDIRWEPSLAAAKAKASRTGKPLLLLHMFGRLDEAFC